MLDNKQIKKIKDEIQRLQVKKWELMEDESLRDVSLYIDAKVDALKWVIKNL